MTQRCYNLPQHSLDLPRHSLTHPRRSLNLPRRSLSLPRPSTMQVCCRSLNIPRPSTRRRCVQKEGQERLGTAPSNKRSRYTLSSSMVESAAARGRNRSMGPQRHIDWAGLTSQCHKTAKECGSDLGPCHTRTNVSVCVGVVVSCGARDDSGAKKRPNTCKQQTGL